MQVDGLYTVIVPGSKAGRRQAVLMSFLDGATGRVGVSILESLASSITITLIHQASGGILRTIGTIAKAALLKASLGSIGKVEAEHVQSVIQR